MERSEWPDDDASTEGAYPPAPLPPHERAWRHPSEIGSATWVHTEPPLTLGRGLMLTTGAIGGLLSLALLWAMLPSAGRGGVASPTVVSSTANESTGLVSAARAETFVATSMPRTASTIARTTVSSPASIQPSPTTTVVERTVPTTQATPADVEETPLAVGIGDPSNGAVVITTAKAVQGRSSLTVRGNKGSRHNVHVLMVDAGLGLAVLASEAASLTDSYPVGHAPAPGDTVTVLGSVSAPANVRLDDQGHLTLDAWMDDVAEGTPVVNADGELVGMCSHTTNGPVLVTVENLAAMLPPSKPAAAGPWLAVHVIDSSAGPAIDGIDPNGPAGVAGLVIGDTITAVDGKAVTTVDQLKTAIAAHAPGDAVVVTVFRQDQTTADVSITLGTAPSM